jgi:peptide/nickel transport system substrate-binding protein
LRVGQVAFDGRQSKAVSTTIAVVVIIILVVAAVAGIYVESLNHGTTTTTVTTTGSGTTETITTGSSASSSGQIPAGEVLAGVVGPTWGSNNVGNDPAIEWPSPPQWLSLEFEQLFQLNPSALKDGNYVIVPWLASNYTESASGLVYTINLRQNVHFHNGDVMTAQDVQYSLDRFVFYNNFSSLALNAEAGGLDYRDYYSSWNHTSIVGPYTIQIVLNQPDPAFFAELSSVGASILDSKVMEAHAVVTGTGANATSDYGFTWLDSDAGGAGADAGTGPMMIQSFTYEARITLTNFTGYWGGPYGNYSSKVQTEIFVPFSDATTARFALQTGEINMLIDPADSDAASLAAIPGFTLIHSPGFYWYELYTHPVGPLADYRVRQAIWTVINYTAVNQVGTAGLAYVSQSQYPLGGLGYNQSTATYWSSQNQNVSGAKKLLAEAGYAKGFTINLYTRPGTRFGANFEDIAEEIQSDLAEINITAVIEVYTVAQFYDLAENTSLPGIWSGVFDGLSFYDSGSNLEGVLGAGDATYLGWNATTEKGPGVPFAQINQLYSEEQSQVNTTLRGQELAQLDRDYVIYGPSLPLLDIPNLAVVSSTVTGVVWFGLMDTFLPEYISVS